MPRSIKTLEKTSFLEIAQTFNDVFADYFFPVRITKEQLEDKFSYEGGRLDLSVGIFENRKLVAFMLHFIKVIDGEKIIYNGGTGVDPEYRGNQLTSKMYDFIIPILKDNHVARMVLEVITKNSSAFKIYRNRGFQILREVECFQGKLNGVIQNELSASFEIIELTDLDWNSLQSFWDYVPTWQNSITTMNNRQQQNLQLGILQKGTIVGYLIYNPKLKRIHQLAIDKAYRNRGLGSQLLNRISGLEVQNITVINIDSRMKNLKSLLQKRGLQYTFKQYEMELKL